MVTYAVEVTIDASVLRATNPDAVDAAYSNGEFLSLVTSMFNVSNSLDASVWGVSISYTPPADDGEFVVEATVTANAYKFLGLGESSADLPDAGDVVSYELSSLSNPASASLARWFGQRIVTVTFENLDAFARDGLAGVFDNECFATYNESAENCQAAFDATTLLIDNTEDISEFFDVFYAACPDFDSTYSCPANETELISSLSDNTDLSGETILALTELLAGRNLSDIATFLVSETFEDAVGEFYDLQTGTTISTAVFTATSDWIPAAGGLPLNTITLALSEDNAAIFLGTLEAELVAQTFITGFTNVNINLPTGVQCCEIDHTVNRVGEDEPIAFQIEYEFESDPSEVDSFAITFGTAAFDAVRDIIERVVASFDSTTPPCFDIASNSFDVDCLDELASEFVQELNDNQPGLSHAEVADLVSAFIGELIECGGSGRGVDGECLNAAGTASNQDAVERSLDELSVNAAQAYATPAPSTGTAGGIGIYAGAGAGGLVVIIVIIVIIVKRGGGEGGKGDSDAGRTVVAFENPMYDTPDQADAGQAIYEDAGGDDEGLYDEPAFNDAAKMNPLYQSTEDLTIVGDGGEEEGGYLDVAPEDE
jgi:hypothetical protein